jgi:hypothetical protein
MMWEKRPVKAIANGEPTYEHIGEAGRAAGWWQGHEAWQNLTAGGTMGVVYGAGSLWQWRLDTTEEHQEWCVAHQADWREALDFEGSRYVGILSRIFEGLPFAGMEPNYQHTYGRPGLIVPGKFYLVYLYKGGSLEIAKSEGVPEKYRVLDPKTADIVASGEGHGWIQINTNEPRVVIFADFDAGNVNHDTRRE